MKRVEVTWEDVYTEPGWFSPSNDFKPALVTQVGYIHKKTKTHLILVSSYTSDGDIGDPTNLPIGLVRKIRVI